MASLNELDNSLDSLFITLNDLRGEVLEARDARDPKYKSLILKKIQAKLVEAVRVIPFDPKFN